MTQVADIQWLMEEHLMRCPGCKSWQLHYRWIDLQDLIRWTVPSSVTEPLDASLEPARECVEVILRDHVAHECPAPRLVMQLWKMQERTRSTSSG
jgi:hypothetical protein